MAKRVTRSEFVAARATGRIRQNDPEGLRAKVLDAAARLFQTRGYHPTSMRDIMDVTRVSAGALHHHFPTKDSLALAVIKDRVAPVVRKTWIDPVRTAASLSKAISLVFAGIIRGIEQRGSVAGCPLNNLAMELSTSEPQFRDALRSLFGEWQAALEDRLSKTRGGARLDRAKRAAAATFVVASYSGAMNLAKAMQSASPLRSAASTLSQWLSERDLDA
jgi:TetR/AcrR family transcriptional repressor of nem operon